MREIKFRAWDGETMWLNVVFKNRENVIYCRDNESLLLSSEEYPLMQFTGLTDKNRKEIYEGDIIKIVHEENEHEHDEDCEKPCLFKGESKNVEVKWDKEFGGFIWNESEVFDGEYTMGFSAEPYIYEVIGNIHEHPEILKTN